MLKRSNLPDLYLEDALPALESIIDDEYAGFEPRCEMIFNVKDSSRSIEQTTQLSALAAAGAVNEGASVPMRDIQQGFDKTYSHTKYGLMISVSQESIDDGNFDIMAKHARKLARALVETQEIQAAAIFNSGFGDTGPDGVSLFNTAHPLLAPGAGTSSNTLASAADLSSTSLKSLLTVMRQQKDSAGNRINIRSKKLIVPSDLEFTAHELLESINLVDSANASVNATNSIRERYSMEPLVWDYLTDSDAWFLAADKDDHELRWFWRSRPSVSSDMDFKTDVALMRILARFSVGYSDWRGIAGTEGAG